MLTLYGDLDSGNVYKVRLILAQLGIAYRRVDTTQNRGEPATAEFRAINPIGKIPTIVFDDGRMLSESGAILYFLSRDTALFPADAWDQANVLRWMFFEQYSHEPYIAVNRHWKLHLPSVEQSRLADRIAQNHARGEYALAVMEQRLNDSAWLAAGVIQSPISRSMPTRTRRPTAASTLSPVPAFARGSIGCVLNPDTFRRCRKSKVCRSSDGRADPVLAISWRTGADALFVAWVLRFRPPQGESLWLVLPLLILVQITSL